MAATASTQQYINIARALPPRLKDFFRRHPPALTLTSASNNSLDLPVTTSSTNDPNPFLPFKNPMTGRWRPPTYSLRRQADLIKLASKHNCLTLLPQSPKLASKLSSSAQDAEIRVKGTGVGQRVKGKLWERTQKGRLEARRRAMEGMDELVKSWKLRGHGRGWKKWPRKGVII